MNLQRHSIDIQFSYKISFSINEILKDWSCIQHSNTYLTSEYLSAIENSNFSYLNFVYIVIYDSKVPVGVMYFQCLEINNDIYSKEAFPKEIYKLITSNMLKSICGNLMICGNFFATGANGFALDKSISYKIALKVIDDLKKQLEKSKLFHSINLIMFKEFWKSQDVDFQNHLTSYVGFEIDVNMVLYVNAGWNSFQDYLDSMKTKYRTRAKSVYKKTNKVQEKLLTSEEIKEHKETIERLYLSVVNTANFNLVTFSDKSFYLLKENLNDNFLFTGYFLENKLIAFSTACFTNDCLDANYVGIDYLINESMPLYQRVLYDYVQLAIKYNVKELRLGRTAEIMKSSIGAEPVHMFLYIKHTNKIVSQLLKPLAKKIKNSEYIVRKPFKAIKNI